MVGAVVPVVFGVLAGDSPGLTGWIGVVVAMPAIYLVSRADGWRGGRPASATGWRPERCSAATSCCRPGQGETGLWPLLAPGRHHRPAGVGGGGRETDWIAAFRHHRRAVIGVGALDVVGNIGYLLAAGVGNLVMVAVAPTRR